jgi:hypothetical protein
MQEQQHAAAAAARMITSLAPIFACPAVSHHLLEQGSLQDTKEYVYAAAAAHLLQKLPAVLSSTVPGWWPFWP